MGHKYAVLISSSHSPFMPEFFFDVVNMRQTLLDHGFASNNIFVLYGNGNDYASPDYPAAKYRPNPAITNLSATVANVQQIFTDLSSGANGRPQVTNQDLLFVYTFDHGSDQDAAGNSISVLCLNDANMRADDFATAVNQVAYAYRIFCMQQCFSGGFISHLQDDRTVILTAASSTEVAHPTDTESETIASAPGVNVQYPHGEFDWYLFAALDGQTLDGVAVNADADTNGYLTMHEVFNYIAGIDSRPETPQYDGGTSRLGDRLYLEFADLCLRDNLADTGVEPSGDGLLCMSPDINHFRNQLLDPAAALLSVDALGKNTLFENIERGQSNWIYLRVRNRGYSAGDGTVDVYWSLPSTLPTPAGWHHIGSVAVPQVQPDTWTVAGPLEWLAVDLPNADHCCFIALLSNAQDPAPDLTTVTDSASFQQLIRGNNNVVWKNFDVQDLFAGGYATVDFHVQGWPRTHCESDLELELGSLPPGVETSLRVARRISSGTTLENLSLQDESALYVQYRVVGRGRAAIRAMQLEPSDKTDAVLTIELPENTPEGMYDIWVRQMVGKRETGRVSRRIAVGEYPYAGNRSTKELHLRGKCTWESQVSGRNRVAFQDARSAVARGYNGCATCMPEIDTDRRRR